MCTKSKISFPTKCNGLLFYIFLAAKYYADGCFLGSSDTYTSTSRIVVS